MDDLGLFGNANINRWVNPFFEVEYAGITLLQQGDTPLTNNNPPPQFLTERIYNDSLLSSSFTLRLGKMLSPVGEWNQIHVPPLVWTTIRPMVTYYGFSQFTSGISILYANAKDNLPDIQVYFQPAGELFPIPLSQVNRLYENVSGFHLNWPFGLEEKVGVSVQHAQVKDINEQQTLLGLNITKDIGRFELESEAFQTNISGSNSTRLRDTEWGAYLQGTFEVNELLHLVGRYEDYVDRNSSLYSSNALVGVAYKSSLDSHLVLKLEYVKQDGQILDIQSGIYGSVSGLF